MYRRSFLAGLFSLFVPWRSSSGGNMPSLNVNIWSKTASDNNNIDSGINWLEGQLPGTVNSSARGMMAAFARWLGDNNGTIVTAGSANAYTLTSTTDYTALIDGIMIGFQASFTNTGAATLLLNALGPKAIRVHTIAGDSALAANNILIGGHYVLRYDAAADSAAGAWILLNPYYPIVKGKNLARNGDFLIKQFGTTFTNVTSAFVADRWYLFCTSANTVSFVANPFTGSGCRNGIKIQRTPGQTWTNGIFLFQTFLSDESSALQGKRVAASCFIKGGTNLSSTTAQLLIFYGKGTDQSSAGIGGWTGLGTVAQQTATISAGVVTQLQISGTVPTDATQLGVYLTWTPAGTAGADDSMTVSGLDFREGYFTPDVFERKPWVDEWLDCSAFYQDKARLSDGTLRVGVIAPCFANSNDGVTQYWLAHVPHTPKRLSEGGTGLPSLTVGGSHDLHVTLLAGTSVWELTMTEFGHHLIDTSLLGFSWTIDGTHPAVANGYPGLLAVDGTATAKFAIDCNL